MRRLLAVAGLFACAGTPQPAPPMPGPSVPFFVTSLQSSYMVRGELSGRVGQGHNAVEIQIERLTLVRSRLADLRRIRIRAAVAHATAAGGWDIRTLGPAVAVTRIPVIRDSVLGPFRLSVPLPKSFDVEADYLAFQFEFPDPGPSTSTVTTYACGHPGMFMGSLPAQAHPSGDGYVQAC